MPFLAEAPTLREFADTIGPDYGNPRGPEAVAYALARIGETRRAIETIEDYLPKLAAWPPWQQQMAEEGRAFRHLLLYEPALAAAKLEAWENETIRNLGLERFR